MRVNLGMARVGRETAEPVRPVPMAARVARPGWRDPRLWVGLLIVAASVVVGARVLAAADDTVEVWAVGTDAGPGAELSGADLEVRRVRFADGDTLAGYFTVDDDLPSPLHLLRSVGAGELLPRAAVGDGSAAGATVELPVAVDPDQVPPAVHAGSVVDVYLLTSGGTTGRGARPAATDPADPVIDDATVVAAPSAETAFGTVSGRRQLVLLVSEGEASTFLAAIGGVDEPALTVLRQR